ncbi:phospholipase D family protein [Sphingomonas sp. CV7422]|uniref:phospholipase D family protein n=1 Tax=Sphingomonas sp. CV7422 TaxID=3018036 RepID=UPI0022FDEEF8|nr:phospholipase D family protein [Sphingomonas sp. CV7422]
MDDIELLHGQNLADRIRAICAEESVDCAVAFWSAAVRDDMFPRWKKQIVRIVCDISMGCNSRSTLKAYGAPNNENLKVYDGLHAKIYISTVGAVIASANASLNGIGLQGRSPANMEAGVFFKAETKGWHDAKKLFEELWRSPVIDKRELARAPRVTSDPGKRISSLGPEDPSMLQQVKSYPDKFASVLFLAEHEKISPEDHAKAQKQYDSEDESGAFEPKKRSLILSAEHDEFPPIPASAIMFWHNGRGTKFDVIAYTDVVAVRSRKYTTLWGVKRWDRFWLGLKMQAPERSLSLADQQFIIDIDAGSWILAASDFSKVLLEKE